MEEVRMQMLRPQQILERVHKCPVVYIPLGVLEWHGVQNPFGADALQAEGIAEVCARQGGGIVWPPLYYGLFQDRMETIPRWRQPILDWMGWNKEHFELDNLLTKPHEERERYIHLLVHMLNEAEAMGFAVAVFVAGHYPQVDLARAAVIEFMDARKFEEKETMIAWSFGDAFLIEDQYPNAGDHGACWETSHLMYLYPDQVDLSLLPEKDEDLVGILICNRSPREATAEFGKEIIDKTVEVVLNEVHDRLEHPEYYRGHGRCLMEQRTKRTPVEN